MTELEKLDRVEHATIRVRAGGAGVVFDSHEGDHVM